MDKIVFYGTEEFENKSAEHELIYDAQRLIEGCIKKYFVAHKGRETLLNPGEVILHIVANIFANFMSNFLILNDTTERLKTFRGLNKELHELSMKLFLILETHYRVEEKNEN